MLDLRFNDELVTEKEFKALAIKHLDYFDYGFLCGRGFTKTHSKFNGEMVTFSIPHPRGLSLFGFFYEEMDARNVKSVTENPISAFMRLIKNTPYRCSC